MIFEENVEIIEGLEFVFQTVKMTDSYYIYVGDGKQSMNNLYFSIQTPYVRLFRFLG